ncbi:hypothetical protein LIER_38990 [Lithospermum erythrorhizon]|uniref:Secreted protein n=1 Tax=Lithospermum erythrorhizon TaxID=34254 RepID=A0AAV3QAL6_LITER
MAGFLSASGAFAASLFLVLYSRGFSNLILPLTYYSGLRSVFLGVLHQLSNMGLHSFPVPGVVDRLSSSSASRVFWDSRYLSCSTSRALWCFCYPPCGASGASNGPLP